MANAKGTKKKEVKVTKKNNKKTDVDNAQWFSIWMCLGISIGTGIGAATNNLALWMSLGIVFGLCFGLALSNASKK